MRTKRRRCAREGSASGLEVEEEREGEEEGLQPAPPLTGRRAIRQLGWPFNGSLFNGYILFYPLFRPRPLEHTARRAFHSPFSSVSRLTNACLSREHVPRCFPRFARRTTALKAGDSV